MLAGVNYDRIDDQGLHISVDGNSQVIEVDNVVICAGQLSRDELVKKANGSGNVHVSGGAALAEELDARRAIRQGAELAAGF